MSLDILSKYQGKVDAFKQSYVPWRGKYLSIMDRDLVFYLIWGHAINNDMMLRTLRKLIPGSEVWIDTETKKEIAQKLCDEIITYLKDGAPDGFDNWHKRVCREFLKDFNDRLLAGKYHPIAYGKAQKVVNMTFKYLSSCDDAQAYAERFKDCHMPLDRNTLDWYYTNVCPQVKKSHRLAWSNLTEEEYFEIQNNIRAFLAKSGETPLEAEWRIW